MATKKGRKTRSNGGAGTRASSSVDELLLAAVERGDNGFETGRLLVTFKEGAAEEGLQSLGMQGMRVADAREFKDQAATLEDVGDADVVVFSEIGVALLGGEAAKERATSFQAEVAADSPIESIDPEHFMFPLGTPGEYLGGLVQEGEGLTGGEFLRGYLRGAETIIRELRGGERPQLEAEEEALVLGATWGLTACRVPPSLRSGVGIRVATLDTGMDLRHPDFAGRPIVSRTFVGQPVQDLHGHGTHCIGTNTGPKAPAGSTPRYGIGFRSSIFVGKVLSNTGSGTQAGVLAGMNWAIANRCPVISMSLGAAIGVQPSYTQAGQAALNNGCLIVAAAGNHFPGFTGAPANSPTIMSVASLDSNLRPSSFSAQGKIEIAAPGRDVFSSVPMPRRYAIFSGTSMATPHVAGCAALWAETSPALRGMNLWRRLQATARRLPFPVTRVGAGLVQAPS